MLSHLSLSLISVLGLLNTHTHGEEHDTGLVTSGSVVYPHLIGCRSSELATFRCWWSSGTFWNLSEPGALSLYFQMKTITPSEWQECPEYTPFVQNECYFSKEFTRIWKTYCVQLRSTSHTLNITYDQQCFTVENIVYPDPPVALNWTLLNISRSGLNYDIMLRWAPPPSADVQTGWMSLKYEVHYRIQNSSHWDKLEMESGTQQSVYGLHTDKHYELRVRCTMTAFKNFGDFSDSVFIHIPSTLNPESMFQLKLLLIIGVVMLLIFFILVLLSQQQRLMVILLPPVPAPKIKGIDPELLKKGKFEELNSLLSSHHVYKPHPYSDDSWVEFIQIDLDEVSEKNKSLDKHRLLDPSLHGSSRCLGPAHKSEGESEPDIEPDEEERHPLVSRSSSTTQPSEPHGETDRNEESHWSNMDFYAQVSEVTPAGGVVLSPEQHNNTPSRKKDQEGKEDRKKDIQLMVMDSNGGYASDSSAHNLVPYSPSNQDQDQDQPYHVLNPDTEEVKPASCLSDPPPSAVLDPLPDYSIVQEVDQHGLILNPSPAPQMPSCPQNPDKCPPNLPVEYLTPERLENFSP